MNETVQKPIVNVPQKSIKNVHIHINVHHFKEHNFFIASSSNLWTEWKCCLVCQTGQK